MTIKIEIKSAEVETFSGNAKATGKPFTINKQTAYFHGTEPYPQKMEVMLRDPSKPFAPGFYTLDVTSSVYIDRNARLAINPVLVATPAVASSK